MSCEYRPVAVRVRAPSHVMLQPIKAIVTRYTPSRAMTRALEARNLIIRGAETLPKFPVGIIDDKTTWRGATLPGACVVISSNSGGLDHQNARTWSDERFHRELRTHGETTE
ncbi:hypothetical protein Bbelb_392440 [Branchiostoma belcheri]|nr:hypothetical protein Bbelb_392440 [Branchiostoma belcheri]